MPTPQPADPEALAALLPELKRAARGRVRGADAAEDLVQETFLRVLCRLRAAPPVSDIRAYAFATLRSCARRPARTPIPDGGAAAEGLSGPPDAAAAHLVCARALAALARLPPDQAAILRLRGLDGLSYEEIARQTGLPRGTVTSRLSRGRRALRAAMGLPPGAPVSDLIRGEA